MDPRLWSIFASETLFHLLFSLVVSLSAKGVRNRKSTVSEEVAVSRCESDEVLERTRNHLVVVERSRPRASSAAINGIDFCIGLFDRLLRR